MYISKASTKKILKGAGAHRVSRPALLSFHTKLNKMAFSTAMRAVRLAKHAKRKTVGESDVKLAVSN